MPFWLIWSLGYIVGRVLSLASLMLLLTLGPISWPSSSIAFLIAAAIFNIIWNAPLFLVQQWVLTRFGGLDVKRWVLFSSFGIALSFFWVPSVIQWLMLRRQVRRAWIWIPIHLVFELMFSVQQALDLGDSYESYPDGTGSIVVFSLLGVALTVVMALITSGALTYMLRNKSQLSE